MMCNALKLNTLKAVLLVFSFGILFKPSFSYSQDETNKKSDEDKKEIKLKKLIERAEEAFYWENYRTAIADYSTLLNRDPEGKSYYNYQLGLSYLYSNDGNADKSIGLIREAIKDLGDSEIGDIAYYNLGRAYHINNQFDSAIANYDKVLKIIEYRGYDARGLEKEIKKNLNMSKSGKELIKKPIDAKILNAGSRINSSYPDYKPVITADEYEMIFTSRKAGSTGNLKDKTGRYYEDIYKSERDSLGFWAAPTRISEPVNSKLDEASIGLSVDGQSLYLYKGRRRGGEIFVSKLSGTTWSEPKEVGDDVNSKYWETSATISADGKQMFYTSTRKGGQGARDIYVASLIGPDTWGPSKNLGAVVNTPYDEESPFIHPDGKTLYFSSEGHNSMGGFDVFKSELVNGEWTKPVNLGYPLNTTGDEINYVLNASGKRGYFTSSRPGGKGEYDIYAAEFDKASVPLILVRGNVVIEDGSVPVENVNIKVIDKSTGNVIKEVYQPNSVTGKYLMILPPSKKYKMIVEATGYKSQLINIEMPTLNEYYELYQRIHFKTNKETGEQEIAIVNTFNDIRKPINNDGSLADAANANNKDYLKTLTENLAGLSENEKYSNLNDVAKDYPNLLNQTMKMTDPVNAELPKSIEKVNKENAEFRLFVFDEKNKDKNKTPVLMIVDKEGNVLSTATRNTEGVFMFEKLAINQNYLFDTRGMNGNTLNDLDVFTKNNNQIYAIKTKPIESNKYANLFESGTVRAVEFNELAEEGKVLDEKLGGTSGQIADNVNSDNSANNNSSINSNATNEGSSGVFVFNETKISNMKELLAANVQFGYDKSILTKDQISEANRAYQKYVKDKSVAFEITGHTDSKGADEYNKRLSVRRANAVASYLINKGVAKNHLIIKGVGETQPIAPNSNPDGSDNPAGRKKNRRTNIRVLK